MFFSFQGTIVLPNIASSLYDPEHWETPRQFNPGHFLDKDGNFVSQEAFLPFSIGKCTDSTSIHGLDDYRVVTVELRCLLKICWSFILKLFVENSAKTNMIISSNVSQSNSKHLFYWNKLVCGKSEMS